MRSLYLTHPQVSMDPHVPVPLWPLSLQGEERAKDLAARRVVPPGALIFSSREAKALQLAEILAHRCGTIVLSDHDMGENDRSSTGFLPPALFEMTADRFFAEPERSVDGWERAVDAQARIVAAVAVALDSVPPGSVAVFCGHGAVGTLLKCHVAGRPISRSEDQGRTGGTGGGNGFVFDFAAGVVQDDWTPFEALEPGWAEAVAAQPVIA